MTGEIFKTPVSVRFRDIDANGHVNHVVFCTYFEEARKAFFHDLLKITGSSPFPFIMARISCDYLKAIKLNTKLLLLMWVSNMGKKSFSLGYKITDLSDESVIYATGQTVQVCFDYILDESIDMPVTFREMLDNYHVPGYR
jgi:acyl-CoA thioester hydrolase